MQLPIDKIIEMFNNNKSTYEIAEYFKTYPNKIRRLLKKAGVQTRNHAEAQSSALKSGRTTHPTKGKPRTEKTKNAIGEKVYVYWKNLDQKKKEKWVEKCRERWNHLDAAAKEKIYINAGEGIRKAAKEGSILEKFLLNFLREAGYDVIFHKTGLVINDKLEVDLFCPALKTVIEIDGPSHFLPIWGEDKLKQVINADSHKSGLLLAEGYVIIRIKYMVKKLSQKRKRDLGNNILTILNEINNNFPKLENRFIEIEVS
jgi:very-short-patch-repair endonuclease